jgi:hypothetical protein
MDHKFCNDINRMADAFTRIADCAEEFMKRARDSDPTTLADIDRLGPVIAAVKKAFDEMEAQYQPPKEEGT